MLSFAREHILSRNNQEALNDGVVAALPHPVP